MMPPEKRFFLSLAGQSDPEKVPEQLYSQEAVEASLIRNDNYLHYKVWEVRTIVERKFEVTKKVSLT